MFSVECLIGSVSSISSIKGQSAVSTSKVGEEALIGIWRSGDAQSANSRYSGQSAARANTGTLPIVAICLLTVHVQTSLGRSMKGAVKRNISPPTGRGGENLS